MPNGVWRSNLVGVISGKPKKKASGGVKNRGAVLVVDGESIRRGLRDDYQEVLREVERTRLELERYQRQDRPMFERWMNLRFGPALAMLRELDQAVKAKRDLIVEVETEVFFEGCSYGAAYDRVLERRKNPGAPGSGGRLNPDLGRNGEEPKPGPSGPDGERPFGDPWNSSSTGANGADFGKPSDASRGSPDSEARLKELYRSVVRILHPDVQGAMTPDKKELWHRAQAAYEGKDIAGLETILAACEMDVKGRAELTSASLLKQILEQARSKLRSFKAELRAGRKDPAWAFSEKREPALKDLAGRMEEAMAAELGERQEQISRAETTILEWEQEALRLRNPSKAAPRRRQSPRKRKSVK